MFTPRRDLFEGNHRDDDGARNQKISIAVICREGFMREAIQAAMVESGFLSVFGAPDIASLGDRRSSSNAILYIENSEEDGFAEEDLELLDFVSGQNWIVMSRRGKGTILSSLIERGARVSIVPFNVTCDDLAHLAMLAANRHRVCVDEFCKTEIAAEAALIKAAKLSPDNSRLMQYLSEGFSNKEIAAREGCTENAVKMRVRALLAKLGVQNRTRAAVMAARAGMRYETKDGAGNADCDEDAQAFKRSLFAV